MASPQEAFSFNNKLKTAYYHYAFAPGIHNSAVEVGYTTVHHGSPY